MTFNPIADAPIECPTCGTLTFIQRKDETGRFFYCRVCDKTIYFFDFRCPVCKKMNTMYEKPLIKVCYQCDNCFTIVIFTEVIDKGDKYDVKWKWYSGKYKDMVVQKLKKEERK